MKKTTLLTILLFASFASAQEYPQISTHFHGDISNDSIVGTDDLMLLLSLWGNDYKELIWSTCGSPLLYDNYEYELVLIGDQCWFAENVRAEHYSNGDSITHIIGDSGWISADYGARTIAQNVENNLELYGYLYNWYAVDDARGLCPTGWHVPTLDDWFELSEYLGCYYDVGIKLKSGPEDSPGWNGTNDSGFSALPGGWQSSQTFGTHVVGVWWSSTPQPGSASFMRLNTHTVANINGPEINFSDIAPWYGHSVRCLKN